MEATKNYFIEQFESLVLEQGNKYFTSFGSLSSTNEIQCTMGFNDYYYYRLKSKIILISKDDVLIVEFDLVKKEMLEIIFKCLLYTDFNDINELEESFLYFQLGCEKSLIEYTLNNYFK